MSPHPIRPRLGGPERVYAAGQPEYEPLAVACYDENWQPSARGGTIVSRWTFSADERQRIAAGEDLFIGILTFGKPLQPLVVEVGPPEWAKVPPRPPNPPRSNGGRAVG